MVDRNSCSAVTGCDCRAPCSIAGPGSPLTPAAASPSPKLRDEFRALSSTSGVYDLGSRARIRLTGGDRVRWLNGMVTNNIRDLVVGQGGYAVLLSPQGHILGDLHAYNMGKEILVDTGQSQLDKILATFDHYIIMDDVEVTNLHGQVAAVGIAGPESSKVLKAAGFAIGERHPLQVAELDWNGIKAQVIAGEHEQYPSSEIWVSGERAGDISAALVQAGAKSVGGEALEIYRIALACGR